MAEINYTLLSPACYNGRAKLIQEAFNNTSPVVASSFLSIIRVYDGTVPTDITAALPSNYLVQFTVNGATWAAGTGLSWDRSNNVLSKPVGVTWKGVGTAYASANGRIAKWAIATNYRDGTTEFGALAASDTLVYRFIMTAGNSESSAVLKLSSSTVITGKEVSLDSVVFTIK